MVIDSLGHVWLRDRVCLRAIGLSTTLVEASVIVGAVRAVVRCILRHVVSVGSIWPWSDSLEGIQGIQSIRLSNKAAAIIDRVYAHATIEGFSINWSWVQAQHDSKRVDWISRCNGVVDADANLAAEGDAQVVYVMEEWIDVLSVFAVSAGQIIVDLRKFLLGDDGPCLSNRLEADGSPKQVAKTQLRPWALLGL